MSVSGFDGLDGAPVNGVPGMMQRVRGWADAMTGGKVYDASAASTSRDAPAGQRAREQYRMLRALADNTNAYEELADLIADYDIGEVSIQGLGNPTNAFCTFYESTIWMGTIREDDAGSALPLDLPKPGATSQPELDAITARQDNLRRAIHRVWRWSNWNNVKDTTAYECALLGDQIFKCVSDEKSKRAWFEMVQPEQLTEVHTDGREYLTFVRLDARVVTTVRGVDRESWITRVWDKDAGTESVWEHTLGYDKPLDELGEPTRTKSIKTAYGVDFVPLVHWRFRASSDSERGVPGIMRAFDKIVYLDIVKTALFQRMHRHGVPDLALVKQLLDAKGDIVSLGQIGEISTLTLGGGKVLDLPQGVDVKTIVSAIDYAAHLAIIQDHYEHLMRTDLPELVWNTVSEAGNAESGRALDYRLTPAKTNVEKARGRAESELIRVTQMCLTIAQQMGAPGFSREEIGVYENGDFDFWIADRPIVPMSRLDDVAYKQAQAQVFKTLTDGGADTTGALETAGYTPDEVERLMQGDMVLDIAPSPVAPYTEPNAVRTGAADDVGSEADSGDSTDDPGGGVAF